MNTGPRLLLLFVFTGKEQFSFYWLMILSLLPMILSLAMSTLLLTREAAQATPGPLVSWGGQHRALAGVRGEMYSSAPSLQDCQCGRWLYPQISALTVGLQQGILFVPGLLCLFLPFVPPDLKGVPLTNSRYCFPQSFLYIPHTSSAAPL